MALRIHPVQWTTYGVEAASLAGVIRAIDGRAEAGECRWSLYTDDYQIRNGRPHGVVLHLEVTIELPRWVGREGAPAADKAEWDRFLAALRRHEEGHRSIARRGMGRMHRALLRALAVKFNDVFAAHDRRIKDESAAYDRTTDHGRRQGTVVNLPGGAGP